MYVGVTSNLKERIYEHKIGKYKNSFSYRYNLKKLVYYEGFTSIEEAIIREKKIKGGSRTKKIELINSFNTEWRDLYEKIEFNM